ncbi:MAG: molybdate ABC transporter substrate-binding protein [Candidatus Competibacteraceae bacterium]|nr:MAG: molybdate ABC transporter substrate-binding protein [Candidatus Competibacteraceae bacterium]
MLNPAFLGALLWVVLASALTVAQADSLFIYSGAGLRQAVQPLIDRFERETGVQVFVEYGGMGQMTTRFETTQRGDVYISGARFYTDQLAKKGLISDVHPLVYHTAVIGVNRARAATLTRFEDLASPGRRLALGDPKAMALGRTAESILDASGLGDAIRANVVARGATDQQVTLYVVNGDVDAGIISRTAAVQYADRIAIVDIPTAYYQPEEVTIGVLSTTQAPERARQFVAWVTSKEGIAAFTQVGFLPIAAPAP